MLGARLLQLIQSHAGSLTSEVMTDLRTNERTPSFRPLSASGLESRIGALYSNLGKWIGDADENAIRDQDEEMGRRRFRTASRSAKSSTRCCSRSTTSGATSATMAWWTLPATA